MTLASKFVEVMLHSLHFLDHSVFYNSTFCDISRFFCKVANFQDINLEFGGSISDVNIDNPTKSLEANIKR